MASKAHAKVSFPAIYTATSLCVFRLPTIQLISLCMAAQYMAAPD